MSHLLKYAKEEDYKFENVNLSWVLDGALTQMRSKLEANSVAVSRAYLSGPTVRADADKLRQVFSNMIDNAIDAMESRKDERRLEFAIQNNGNGMAAVRIRDNGSSARSSIHFTRRRKPAPGSDSASRKR